MSRASPGRDPGTSPLPLGRHIPEPCSLTGTVPAEEFKDSLPSCQPDFPEECIQTHFLALIIYL